MFGFNSLSEDDKFDILSEIIALGIGSYVNMESGINEDILNQFNELYALLSDSISNISTTVLANQNYTQKNTAIFRAIYSNKESNPSDQKRYGWSKAVTENYNGGLNLVDRYK